MNNKRLDLETATDLLSSIILQRLHPIVRVSRGSLRVDNKPLTKGWTLKELEALAAKVTDKFKKGGAFASYKVVYTPTDQMFVATSKSARRL